LGGETINRLEQQVSWCVKTTSFDGQPAGVLSMNRFRWSLFTCLLLVGLVATPLRESSAIDRMQPKVLAAFRDVVSGASRSTVKVLADGKQIALGTIVTSDGYISTKASELKGKLQVQLFDGRKLDARQAATQRDLDLALLKIDAEKLPVAPWSDAPAPLVGSWLATPDLRKEPVSIGVVSVAPRTIPAPP
jgi:serine protease Do